jgi:peptide/nickel transport system substrate-binding protein
MNTVTGRLVAFGFLSLSLLGCNQERPADTTTLVIARAGDNVSLDPAVSVGSSDGTIIALCYQRLTAIDPTSPDGAVVGDLAQSWSASADGMEWTFHLKPDVRFASGNPVTASDVVGSFERIGKIGRSPAQGMFWLKSADAPDPRTVRFKLNLPFPVLPKILTLTSGSVVDMKAVQSHLAQDLGTAWLSENCAGSGAYRLDSWQRGQRLTMVTNTNSAMAHPHFDKVVFKIIPDASSRRAQIERGDVDLIDGIGAAEAEHYAQAQGLSLARSPASNTLAYLTLNNTRAPLNDVRVRKAIAESIDYQAIRDKVLRGNAIVMRELIPKGIPGFDPGIAEPTRDLAGARALLKESGHADGIDVTMLVGEAGPVAELIQSNLAEAGIRLHLLRLAPAALDTARATGDFDIIYDGWILDFPDPFIFLNLAFSSPKSGGVGNFSHYENAQVEGLLQAAMISADSGRRTSLYRQAQSLIMADQPIVPLFSPVTIFAYRSALTGVRVNPYQPNYLDIVDISRKPQ